MTAATKHLLSIARERKRMTPLGREKIAETLRRWSHQERRKYYHSLSVVR